MPLGFNSSGISALTQNADDSVLIGIQIRKVVFDSVERKFIIFKGRLGKFVFVWPFQLIRTASPFTEHSLYTMTDWQVLSTQRQQGSLCRRNQPSRRK